MIDMSSASIRIAAANIGHTRWEIDVTEIYVTAESRAEAVAILTDALGGVE